MLITNRAQRYGTFAAVGVLALSFGLAAAGPSAKDADRLGAGLVAFFAAVCAIRCLRVGVDAGDVAVVIRNFVSTRVIAWTQIKDISTVDSGNVSGRATCIAFVLRSGEVVRAQATGSFRAGKVASMLTAIERARPSTPSP